MSSSIPFKKFISARRPFFLYDEKQIISNILNVDKFMSYMFSTNISLAFSLKTQPNYKVIETIRNRNLSLDVSSLNELNYALSLGFEPSKIFLGGVGLNDRSISQALSACVGGIHLNSIALFDLALEQRRPQRSTSAVSLRFHPEYLKGTKLGETKNALIQKFGKRNILDGLHVYVGRESFDQTTVHTIFSDVEDLVKAQVFKKDWTLFFGPGLPDLIQSPLESFKVKHNIEKIKIEVGRSITSSCGYYGAPVLSVKQFRDERKTVIIDGGLQHFGSPWVNLRQGPIEMKGMFCDPSGNVKEGKMVKAAIYGSLCLWHDCLHPSFPVPSDIKRGDWIAVPHMGAYGLTAGVPLFIGETLPQEFYFDGKQYLNVTHHGFGKTTEE